jgi:imidazolonepropionase-like amidohydrolase
MEQETKMIISAQTLITGDGKTVLTDSGVLVADGKIAAVDKTAALLSAYPNEEHVNYGKATILPGLIDMHVHLGLYAFRHDEKQYTDHLKAYLALNNAQRFLKNGVTTVRDVFSPNDVCRQLVYAASKGLFQVPRIFYVNEALTISGGVDWAYDGAVQVDGPEAIRKAVREQVRSGATWIKAMCDARTPGLAEFDQDELNVIVRAAHHRGCKAAAHANLQPALQMCIDAGFDTIEHACRLTVDQANEMAEKGIAVVSTYYVYEYLYEVMSGPAGGVGPFVGNEQRLLAIRSSLEAYQKNYPEIFKTGVTVLAGTDCPFDGLEHITVAWELQCLVKLGMPPLEAIASAASKSATVLGMEGKIGILAPGAIADITIADAATDKDITALQRIKDVYQDGTKVCL